MCEIAPPNPQATHRIRENVSFFSCYDNRKSSFTFPYGSSTYSISLPFTIAFSCSISFLYSVHRFFFLFHKKVM